MFDPATGLAEAIKPEQYSYYGGTKILFYEPKSHTYYMEEDGEKILVPGVTTVIEKINKPALVQWAANTTIQYVKEKLTSVQIKVAGVLYNYSLTNNVLELLEMARFNYKTISKAATDTGHMAHERLQQILLNNINDEDAVYLTLEDEKAQKCVDAALDWMNKHDFKPLSTEVKILSATYHYAGTYDFTGNMVACGGECCGGLVGHLHILGDFKSSKAIYNEYRIQTAAYVVADREERTEAEIDARLILRLGKEDGEFEALLMSNDSLESDFNAFVGLLAVYSWEAQLKEDAKGLKLLAKYQAQQLKEQAKQAAKALKTKKIKKAKSPESD